MTNINCISNCVYQKDGKCSFDRVNANTLSTSSNCAYYISTNITNSNKD